MLLFVEKKTNAIGWFLLVLRGDTVHGRSINLAWLIRMTSLICRFGSIIELGVSRFLSPP